MTVTAGPGVTMTVRQRRACHGASGMFKIDGTVKYDLALAK
jgi:hypothetical protein